uniref:Uncharacterized protein n=1 Tax=Arundo donax TaxID=35708 RepID=A0A0A9CT96_ARUDO
MAEPSWRPPLTAQIELARRPTCCWSHLARSVHCQRCAGRRSNWRSFRSATHRSGRHHQDPASPPMDDADGSALQHPDRGCQQLDLRRAVAEATVGESTTMEAAASRLRVIGE